MKRPGHGEIARTVPEEETDALNGHMGLRQLTVVDGQAKLEPIAEDVDLDKKFVVAIVSSRLDENDNDGVSLEAVKWAKALNDMGAVIVFFSGKTLKKRMVHDWAEVESAGFKDCRGADITKKIFDQGSATDQQKADLREDADEIKGHLKTFLKRHKVNYVIPENLCFPVNFALTDAVYETLEETKLPYALHQHDPAQERERFQTNDPWTQKMIAKGILGPPSNRPDKIIAINEATKKVLLGLYGEHMNPDNPFIKETGIHLVPDDISVIGNKMPFYTPPRLLAPSEARRFDSHEWFLTIPQELKPKGLDKRPPEEAIITTDHVADYRTKFLPDEKDTVFLMPLRIIPRKFMELGIEWVHKYHERFKKDSPQNTVLLFTHPWGDEGPQYWNGLRKTMKDKGFEHIKLGDKGGLKYVHSRDLVAPQRRFPLGTPFAVSNMVLIPSVVEGWCNAIAESMYYGVPLGIHPFPVYRTDLEKLDIDAVKTKPIKLPPHLQDLTPGMKPEEIDRWFGKRCDVAKRLVTPEMLDATHALITDPVARQRSVDHNYQVGLDHLSFRGLAKDLDTFIGPHMRRFNEGKLKA